MIKENIITKARTYQIIITKILTNLIFKNTNKRVSTITATPKPANIPKKQLQANEPYFVINS